MRERGQLKAQVSLGLIALSTFLFTVLLAAACSGGGDEVPVVSDPTSVALQSTAEPSPFPQQAPPAPEASGPILVAPPRAGASLFNVPDRDHSISGFIVDAANGRPLRGVSVRDGEDGEYGISDVFGFYRIDGLAPGRHGLVISGYRVEPATAEIDTETWTRLDLSVSVVGEPSSRLVFDITGRVTDRDSGDPTPNALVSARAPDGVIEAVVTRTDEFGAYVIAAVPQAGYDLSVEAPGYPVFAEHVDVSGDMDWEVFLRATPSRITGQVTGDGPNGTRPPPGAVVRALSLGGGAPEPGLARRSVAASGIGPDGVYSLEDLPPGEYRVEAAAPGYLTTATSIVLTGDREPVQDFDLALDGASLNVDLFSSTYGGIALSGMGVRIQGIGGTPAEGVLIDATTGLDGSVLVDGLPAGMYDVWTPAPRLVSGVNGADLYPAQKTLQLAPGESITLNADLPAVPGDVHGFVRAGDLAGGTRLETSLRDASDSSTNNVHESFAYLPVQLPGALVSITAAHFGNRSFTPPVTSVESDGYGNFVLPLPPGSYTIEVTAAGHLAVTTEITVGSSPVTNDFRLARATTALVGRVDGTMIHDLTHLTEAAFAVAQANVTLRNGDLVYSALTDNRGVFAIEDLPLTIVDGATVATEYVLQITHPDYMPLTEPLDLTAAEGSFRIVRQFPAPATGGFLDITIAVTDKNGVKTAAIGTLENIQHLRTMDVYDASFLKTDDTIEIPNLISIRARPGEYRARICPDTPGELGCFDHFWTSKNGTVDSLDLSLNCGESIRLVECSLDGGIGATEAGHIQATGFIYSASTGGPIVDGRVTVELNVVTEYCGETCTGLVREFAATGPTGPNGRYQLEFQIPSTNGGANLVGWSWGGTDRVFTVTSPGYEAIVDNDDPTGSARLFNGTQDFYLTPSGGLNILVVSASSEGAPVSGIDTGLGIPVDGPEDRAVVTLSPLGAELGTGSSGVVSFKVPEGNANTIVNAPGHYPYSASVLVPDTSEDEAVDARFTFQIEEIPPPRVQANSLQITGVSDGSALKGYVLRGISSSATSALWEVRVDRNGERPLRENFEDPIKTVDLVVDVSESCPGAPNRDGAGRTLHLRGTLLSGSSIGVGTWGGTFDIADLPCGALGWRIEARTSRSIARLGFDWPLWPADQRYPLSLLTDLGGASTTPSIAPVVGSVGNELNFDVKPGSLRVTHDGEYLRYEIPDIIITSDFGPPATNGRLLGELAGTGHPLSALQSVSSTAVLDGQTGLFALQPSTSSEPAPYAITATGLISLDSAVIPASDAGSESPDSWVEKMSAILNEARIHFLESTYLPDPLRAAIDGLATPGIDGVVIEDVFVDATWTLASPPEPGEPPPFVGERRVVAGTRFEIVSVSQFEFATSVMSHLTVDGQLDSRSVATFADTDGSGSLRQDDTVATGGVKTSSELWSVWVANRENADFTFFDRDGSSDSIARSSVIEGEPAWTASPTSALVPPGSGNAPEVVAGGGLPRASISAGRNSNGQILISAVSIPGGAASPGVRNVSLLESYGDGGAWSPPSSVLGQPDGMVTDTAVAFTSEGDTLLVWSVVPDVSDDPGTLIIATTQAELFFSRQDADSGVWSSPEAVTSDNRPDFAPVIGSDGEGRIILAWARDMDGNVLTADDIVVFASEWVAGGWTVPIPVMPVPGAASEISISLASGIAVIGVVAEAPGFGRAINLSFNNLGRWSPVNVIAGGRPGLSDVAVLMDESGLASVAWNELRPGLDGWRIVAVEATSAGVRGETIVADGVAGFVDLNIVPSPGSRSVTWTGEGGFALYSSRYEVEGWSAHSLVELEFGRSTRFVAVPGEGGDSVLTFHEMESDGVPGLAFVPVLIR